MTTVTVTTSTAVVQVVSPTAATVNVSGAATATVNQDQATVVSNLDQVNTIASPAWIQFNTGATATMADGRLAWDSENETLQLGVDTGAILRVGQDFQQIVQNDSGDEIPKGTVVSVELDDQGRIRTVGQGIMRIVKTVADGSLPSKLILGVTVTTIANGARGVVSSHGYVNGVDTDTPNWVLGDILWASSTVPGALTNVEPTAPALRVPMAVVTRVQQNTGSFYVRFTPNEDLSQLNDVAIASPQNDQVLKYNSANGTWINGTADISAIPLRSNFYYSAEGSVSGRSFTLNSAYFFPFIFPAATTISRLGAFLVSTALSNTIRLAIYDNTANNEPGDLLDETATISTGTGQALGFKYETVDVTVQQGLYWLAFVNQGSVPSTFQATGFRPYYFPQGSFSSPVTTSAVQFFHYTQTGVTGAFPATATPVLLDSGAAPRVFVGVS